MSKSIFFILGLLLLQELKAQKLFAGYYPGKEESIELPGGIVLSYSEHGLPHGIPVVMLHGYTDSWRSFEPLFNELPADIHVYAISMRGHGNSSKPASGYTPAELAKDIAAFIKKKGIGPVYLAGHSMGGMIAQQLTLDYPELVKGMILISSGPGLKSTKDMNEFYSAINALTDPPDPAFVAAFQESTFHVVEPEILQIAIQESLLVPAFVWKKLMNELKDTNYRGRLAEVKVPVLILWGEKDNVFSLDDQHEMYREFISPTLLMYSGRGHALHWENPQQVASDITQFIRIKEHIDCF